MLTLALGATVAAFSQTAITQNNLLTDGGFDSGQGPWIATGQGNYFYTDGTDTIVSTGWTNGVAVWQDAAAQLASNTDLVITVRGRSGDGQMEGVNLVLLDADTGHTTLTNQGFWFPAADAHQSPGAWRVYSLYANARNWPARVGHMLAVSVSGRDTTAWGQYGWLQVDWVQLAPALPRFTTQPLAAAAPTGASASLTGAVLGAVPTNGPGDLVYQWYKVPATAVGNATNSALFFPSLAASDAGTYFLVASNAHGWCQSSNVILTVLPADTPAYAAYVDPNLAYVDGFEGWGTSLCWWANVVGGYSNRSAYADFAFSQLKLNIVRYNIGGGENPGINNTMEFRCRMPGFEPSLGVWDWTADANQRWMLKAAVARGANRVVAFANSPPWWMTVSGSVTGSTNGTSNNLLTNSETAFAVYLATVMSNLTVMDGVHFDLSTPMNEPNSSWWTLGGRQEGCPMSATQQARMVNALKPELAARGLSTAMDASEDTDQQRTINSVNGYTTAAQSNLAIVATHTYGANNPAGVRNLAHVLGKPLWMSEYGDGDATGMPMARRIHDDLTGMWCRAWVYWQVVDNAGGWGMLYNPEDGSGNSAYTINRKFYVMGQFSQFIRPGCQLLQVGDTNSIAAYTPTNHTLVIVSLNDSTNSFNAAFDLSGFGTLPAQAARYRTSPTENLVPLPALALAGNQLVSYLAAQSVTTHVLTNVFPPPPSVQPLAWYRFETNALDASTNGNNGTTSGSVNFVPGKLGAWAARFDGTSSYVLIPRIISNHFTMALWVKTTATGGTGQWWAGKGLIDGEVGGTTDDFGLSLLGNKATFGVGNPDTTIASTSAINDGAWHHVAATRDAVTGQMLLYVDGVLQASTVGPAGTKAAPTSLRVGSIQTGASGGFLAGAIDDVQLFARVFSATEIPQLMNHAPTLASLPTAGIVAGRTLSLTNVATDPDTPAQTLSWRLLNAPVGATVNATNGLSPGGRPSSSHPPPTLSQWWWLITALPQ